MNALAQLKRDLLAVIRPTALEYDHTLCGRHMLITCDDNYRVDVLWRKDCFMHLCGVRCNRPASMFGHTAKAKGEAEYFYDAVLSGKLSPSSLVVPDSRLARRKAATLPLLTKLPELELILVEAKRDYLSLAIGDERFTLGLAPLPDSNSELAGVPVMFPRSLRAQKVTAIARNDGLQRNVREVEIR